MSKVLNPTHTIFKSKKIEFIIDDNDYRKCIAKEDIFQGDLLLLEHGVMDEIERSNNILVNNLLYNKELWEELYPREFQYNLDNIMKSEDTDNIIDALTQKLTKNIFKQQIGDKVKYTLLRDGSIFNHSKDPNLTYHYILIPMAEGLLDMSIFYFIAYKDIKAGEEVCSNYGNNYFNEDIDLTEYNKKDHDFISKNRSKILTMIDNYLACNDCRDVILNHHFFNNGLVYNQDTNKYISLPSFNKLLKDDENTDITISELNDWINKEMVKVLSFLKTKINLKL